MSTERPLSIPERAIILVVEYTKLIGEFFPGVVTTDEFIATFNHVFISYQKSDKYKLAPQSMRERHISCSSAAALMGLWHELLGNSAAHYLIEMIQPFSGVSKSTAHSIVGLRPANAGLHHYHYTIENGLTAMTPSSKYQNETIIGTRNYLENRLRVLPVKTAHLRTT